MCLWFSQMVDACSCLLSADMGGGEIHYIHAFARLQT
jgi:hypothetical protein